MGLKSHVYIGCEQRRQSNTPGVLYVHKATQFLPRLPDAHPALLPMLLISLLVYLHGCALLSMVSWGTNHSKAILQMIADSGK